MDQYFTLSDEELFAAIRSITLQLTSGATTISSPDAGSVGYSSRSDATILKNSMIRAYKKRLGLPKSAGEGFLQTKIIAKRDYHQR